MQNRHTSFLVLLLCLATGAAMGQALQGFTLFAPNNSRNTYLINMSNVIVKTWSHTKSGGYSYYLLEDGSVLRTASSGNASLNAGGAQGTVQRQSWDGSLLWEYTYSTTTVRAHHDIEPMPNGNVLMIAWETKTAAQGIAAGLNHSAAIWPDHIIEVQPVGTNGGNIVWEWHVWDHLVQDYDATKANYGTVKDHPELLDINVGSTSGDWTHVNGISYNAELDQIVISSHTLDEVYVIDHSTTTAEAASHAGGRYGKGGDILYRWGSPANYDHSGAQVFNVVHCASWVPKGYPGEGHILAFNNREGQGTSVLVELAPTQDSAGFYSYAAGSAYGPASPVWSYTAPDFYSNHLGGVQRLPNGNTLAVESTTGYLREVTSSGTVVWSYNRGGEVVRALRYALDYPGVSKLTTAVTEAPAAPSEFSLQQNHPNPFNPSTIITYRLGGTVAVTLTVYDALGRRVSELVNETQSAGTYSVPFDARGLGAGVYLYRINAGSHTETRRMTLVK